MGTHYPTVGAKDRVILAERQWAVGHLEAVCQTWTLALDDYPLVDSGRIDKRMTAAPPHFSRLVAPPLRGQC